MITLKNKRRQMLVFNLDTPYFREKKGMNGKGCPESITFLALERLEVPDEIQECPEIAAAIARRDLQIVPGRPKAKKKEKES